jgi:hypothetical protein
MFAYILLASQQSLGADTICSLTRHLPSRDDTIDMIFAKDNAAGEGFNRWTVNGVP